MALSVCLRLYLYRGPAGPDKRAVVIFSTALQGWLKSKQSKVYAHAADQTYECFQEQLWVYEVLNKSLSAAPPWRNVSYCFL